MVPQDSDLAESNIKEEPSVPDKSDLSAGDFGTPRGAYYIDRLL